MYLVCERPTYSIVHNGIYRSNDVRDERPFYSHRKKRDLHKSGREIFTSGWKHEPRIGTFVVKELIAQISNGSIKVFMPIKLFTVFSVLSLWPFAGARDVIIYPRAVDRWG